MMKHLVNQDRQEGLCPLCQTFSLATWDELDERERFVLLQRPSPDDESLEHRQQQHCWCRRCGHEHCQWTDYSAV
ncbi:MAG: hypothetical protein RMM98_11375 [Acidobacteriota bacterium]|nr:hypothetical protein [Blastocatellia bacterium]MDW8240207.1 hypothetical protein [Acidobacteriota bacterium]